VVQQNVSLKIFKRPPFDSTIHLVYTYSYIFMYLYIRYKRQDLLKKNKTFSSRFLGLLCVINAFLKIAKDYFHSVQVFSEPRCSPTVLCAGGDKRRTSLNIYHTAFC